MRALPVEVTTDMLLLYQQIKPLIRLNPMAASSVSEYFGRVNVMFPPGQREARLSFDNEHSNDMFSSITKLLKYNHCTEHVWCDLLIWRRAKAEKNKTLNKFCKFTLQYHFLCQTHCRLNCIEKLENSLFQNAKQIVRLLLIRLLQKHGRFTKNP